MTQNRTGVVQRIMGNKLAPYGGATQAPQQPQAQPQGQTLSQMLGGSIYAQQMADDSMNPLALIRQYRETGQLPTGMQQPNVMMGRMPVGQAGGIGAGEMMPAAMGGQATSGRGLK